MQVIDMFRTRVPGRPPAVQTPILSAGSLGRVIVDLQQLNHDTEQDFLQIGGKLTEFMQAVSAISSDLATLANSEGVEHVSQALTRSLDAAGKMREDLGDGDGDLTDMRKEVDLLKRKLTGFERTVSTFHTLALMTRIETARIGSEGGDFESVADDVSELAGQIHARVGKAMTIADSLIPSIECSTREISALETGQAKDLPDLVSRSLASLAAICEIQDEAQESSARLRTQYGAISNSFNKLIISIQFHDITRQQIEHVIEVLQRLCAAVEGNDGGISGSPRGISAVLKLQSAQLADAGEKFATSVAAVERSLEEIARHVVEMARESRALAGIAEGGTGSIFSSMDKDFPAILTSLDQTANTRSATLVAREGLGQIIGQMHDPIHEIQQIEFEMRRIALNAQISACNLGSAGIALDVLAGSVQQLASECRERSESLSSMSWAVTRERRKRQQGSAGGTRATDGTMTELRLAVEAMHSSSERSVALIQQIVARGDSLAGELAATRDSFSAGSVFAEAIERAQGAIGKIGDKAESSLQFGDNEESNSMLADLASNYTMKAERDVHNALDRTKTDSVQVCAPPAESAASSEGGDALGENVEFF